MGKRRNLRQINVLDQFGKVLLEGNADFLADADVPPETMALHGLDRFEARKRIVALFEEKGLLEKIEPHTAPGAAWRPLGCWIEPWLTEQWYVNAAELAKPAIAAVEKGDTSFVPKNWEKTYYEWMRNIQPWCNLAPALVGASDSAWYGPVSVFVEETEEAGPSAAKARFGRALTLARARTCSDTGFFSTRSGRSRRPLGWPDETPELKRHYKTDVLVTGFDIIFFWVARMMMMGLHFMKEVPFHPSTSMPWSATRRARRCRSRRAMSSTRST